MVNEEKLLKVSGAKSLKLASAETVKRVTGAEVGYAGLINLPKEVKMIHQELTSIRHIFFFIFFSV